MKKIYLGTILFLSLLNCKAQFTLENVYDTATAANFFYDQLQNNGEKYVNVVYPDENTLWSNGYEMRIYDLNHSLWKTIDLTSLPRWTVPGICCTHYSILYVTDSLFNTDNLVEFMYAVNWNDTGYNPRFLTNIYDENLTLLFTDSSGPFYTHVNIPQIQVPIVQTSLGAKMILATPDKRVKVFGLQGGLSSQYEMLSVKNNGSSDIYPNPFSGSAVINYSLPAGCNKAKIRIYDISGVLLNTYTIDNTFNNFILSGDDFVSGSYYYDIRTEGGDIIVGKKFITIK